MPHEPVTYIYPILFSEAMDMEAAKKEKMCENILEVLDKVLPGTIRLERTSRQKSCHHRVN